MVRLASILSLLCLAYSGTSQVLDTAFNGYLSPFVITSGSAPTWVTTGRFINENKSFTGAELSKDSKIIVESGGKCYTLTINAITATSPNIVATVTDSSGALTTLPRDAIMARPDSNGIYPYVAGAPDRLQSCIQTSNWLRTIGAVSAAARSFAVLDTTITAVSYTVPLLANQEARVIADATTNNITISLPDTGPSLLGKKITVSQINSVTKSTTINVNGIGNKILPPGSDVLSANIVIPVGSKAQYVFTLAYDKNSATYVWEATNPDAVYQELNGLKFFDPVTLTEQKVKADYEVETSMNIPSITAPVGARIYTAGYTVAGDGGRATYTVDDSGDTPDSITVFSIGGGANRRAKLIGEIVDIRQGGFITGAGLTTQQQKNNWTVLKTLCAKKREVWLPADTLEIYPTDTIDVTSKYLKIRGTSETQTVLSVFPKYKTINRGIVDMIWIDENSVFELEDLTVTQYKNRYGFETYEVTANVDANVNKILVNGTPRVGFFSEFTVGDTLLFQRDSSVVGQLLEVSSIDSVAKTIIFTGSTGASAGYTTASTFVAKPIPAGSEYSEYSAYVKQWNTEHLDRTNFINSNTTLDEFENKTYIRINRCHLKDMDRLVTTIQSFNHLYINDSRLSALAIGIAWTGTASNQDPDIDINLRMNQSTVYECATVVDGSVRSGQPVSTNGVYGGGIYNHSMTPAHISNCSFINNNSTVYRNFSGSKIEVPGRKIVFEDCYFNNPDSDGPNLILPHSMPAYIKNSQFYGVGVYVGFKAHFENCIFNTTVGTNENTTPAPADSVALDISFDNCVFKQGAVVFTDGWSNLGNPSNPLQDSRLSVSNSTFFTGSALQTASEYTSVVNCILKKTIGVSPNPGTSFITVGSISGYNSPEKVYIDNFNIESGAGTEYFIQYRTPWSTTTLIQNSDLEEAAYISREATGIELRNVKHRSGDPFYNSDQMNITDLPDKQRTATTQTKSSNIWTTGGARTLNNILLADFRHDTYVLEDTILKGIHFYSDYSYIGTKWSKNDYVNAEITILPKNGLYIIPYGIDTLSSSFIGTDTVYIPPNTPFKVWCYGPGSLSQTTGLDTLVNITLAADTDSIIVYDGVLGAVRTAPIIPTTVQVYINGVLKGRDEGDWTIESDFVTSGVTVSGGVDYYRKQHGFYFSESLTSGDVVLVVCETSLNPAHKGYQYIIQNSVGNYSSTIEINSNTTLSSLNSRVLVDVSSGPVEIDLPAGYPSKGDYLIISEVGGDASSNNITVDLITAGDNYHSTSNNRVMNLDNDYVRLEYVNSSIGWIETK